MKKKIKEYEGYWVFIRNVINTNILKEIPEPPRPDKKDCNQKAEPNDENAPFSFANIAFFSANIASGQGGRSINPFHNNVIYDFGAEGHLTFEKNRFVGEITPTSKKE